MDIGDYVRTPNGVIVKIIDIQDEEGQYFVNNNVVSLKSKTYIADKNITIGESFKHSPNIIDLIEVGDYVNGYRVIEATPNDKRKKQQITIGVDYREYGEDYLENKDIKSVITKEQFESMEYKL